MDKFEEFSEWLEKELRQRDWSRSDLARAMGVDTAVVSNIMNGVRGIGTDSCRAISSALGVPQLEVYTRAGLIEPVQNHDNESERLIALYRSLPEEKRQAAFMMMQGLHGSGYKKSGYREK